MRSAAGAGRCPAAAEVLIDEVFGERIWPQLPAPMRRILSENGPAVLAELGGQWWLDADAEALAAIVQPVLLVAAEDSRAELREPSNALAAAMPSARLVVVGGGHLIDPAAPDVLAFVREVLSA